MSYENEKIEQDKIEEEHASDKSIAIYEEQLGKPSCYKKQIGSSACFNTCPVKEECYSGYTRG